MNGFDYSLRCGAALLLVLPGAAAAQCNYLVSVDSSGNQGNAPSGSNGLDLTPSGRFIAFESAAENLAGSSGLWPDIFVRDMALGTTVLVSGALNNQSGNDGPPSVSISGDGKRTTFTSWGSTVPDPNGPFSDIFVFDTTTSVTTVVSRSYIAAQGGGPKTANWPSYGPDISRDGRYVAFSSVASDLISGVSGGHVFRRDVTNANGAIIQVSTAPLQPGQSYEPSINGDGSLIAFTSTAQLSLQDTNPGFDVYLRDLRQTEDPNQAVVTLLSVSLSSGVGNAILPSLSDNGRRVAFQSDLPNLVSTPVPSGVMQIYWRDIAAGTNHLASVNSTGNPANANCAEHYMSADGRFVSFTTTASNIDGVHLNQQAYVHDTTTGMTYHVSENSNYDAANATCTLTAVTNNGSTAFSSTATNLVPIDTNGWKDVFLHSVVTNCP